MVINQGDLKMWKSNKERLQRLDWQMRLDRMVHSNDVTHLSEDVRSLQNSVHILQKAVLAMLSAPENDSCDRLDTLQAELDVRMKARITSILSLNSKLAKLAGAMGMKWDTENGDFIPDNTKKTKKEAK